MKKSMRLADGHILTLETEDAYLSITVEVPTALGYPRSVIDINPKEQRQIASFLDQVISSQARA